MPDSYFPLDVNFFDHPKVVERSDTAVRLYLAGNGYANRFLTDGYIAPPIPGRLIIVPWDSNERPEDYVAELVAAILWHEAAVPCPRGHTRDCPEFPGQQGWRIHDFLEHNRSKERRQEAQRAERDRKAAWRERQRKAQNDADGPLSGDAGVPRDRDAGVPRLVSVTGTPNTETETETETELPSGRFATATPVAITPIPTAQTFVAAYVDAYRGRAGHDPPSRVKGHLAKELGRLIADGIPPETIKAGFVEWFDADQHPSTLASFVESRARGGRPRRQTRQQERQDQRIQTNRAMAAWANQEEGGGDGPGGLDTGRDGIPRGLPTPGV